MRIALTETRIAEPLKNPVLGDAVPSLQFLKAKSHDLHRLIAQLEHEPGEGLVRHVGADVLRRLRLGRMLHLLVNDLAGRQMLLSARFPQRDSRPASVIRIVVRICKVDTSG